MTNGIPTPEFTPTPRPRRSSIGQSAALSAQDDASPTPDPSPAAAAPPASSSQGEAPAAAVPTGKPQGVRTTSTPPRPRAARGHNGGAARTGASVVVADAPNKRLVGSKDILLSLPEDLKDRMVNTITWSHPYTGIGQQQKFIRKAIADLCERLENDYNQGKPFPEPVVHDD